MLARRENGSESERIFKPGSRDTDPFYNEYGNEVEFKVQLATLDQILDSRAPISFKLSKDGKPISSLQGEQTGGEGEVWVYYGETIRPALDLTKAVTFRNMDGKIHVGLEPVGQGEQKLRVFEREGSVGFTLFMADFGMVALDYEADSFKAVTTEKAEDLPYNFGMEKLKLLSEKACIKARNAK